MEYGLTGVVICSCSPRMHEATFRKTVQAAGLNPYMLEIANIREQCSWIHKDIKEATEKAIILGRSAIAKVQLNAPLTSQTSPVVKRALVIGGGIAGIQTALDIADAGFEVDIVEKKPTIGGKMSQLDKTFPTLDCAACILTPKMVDAGANDNYYDVKYNDMNFALIMGAEHSGVSKSLLKLSDFIVKIPMLKDFNSLNVSNALSAIIFETVRQRICGR